MAASFGGDPPFWYPKVWSNFIFLLYLPTLKISCVQLKRSKSLKFGGPCLEETPILEFPIFVRLGFILICTYRVVQKKRPILFFLPNVWLRRFCFSFQVVKTVGLGNCLDSKMDVSGRYTVQLRIKIVETYFATKLGVLTQRQCRKELGRVKVPDRKTIEHLVAKFRETGSVTNANKGRSGRLCSVKTPSNVQNLRERFEESPRKSTRLSREVGISRSSPNRILYDDL